MVAQLLSVKLSSLEVVDDSALMALGGGQNSRTLFHYHLRVNEGLGDLILLEQRRDVEDLVVNIDLIIFCTWLSCPKDIFDVLHSECFLSDQQCLLISVLLKHRFEQSIHGVRLSESKEVLSLPVPEGVHRVLILFDLDALLLDCCREY